jgi:OHCU decarboxylase
MTDLLEISVINTMDKATFVATFGDVYEHTPRVASDAFVAKPFESCQHLATAMATVVANFAYDEKLRLVLEHPRLGKRGKLTASSESEQASIGLNKLGDAKLDELAQLNDDYFDRFQFPFIVAVKLLAGRDVRAVIKERSLNDVATEFATALEEIDKIAAVRLALLMTKG